MRGPQRLPGVNGFMYDHGSLPIIIEIEWMKIPIPTVLFLGGMFTRGMGFDTYQDPRIHQQRLYQL